MLQKITQRTHHVFDITRTAPGIFQKLRQSIFRRESPDLKPKVGKLSIMFYNLQQSVTQNHASEDYVHVTFFPAFQCRFTSFTSGLANFYPSLYSQTKFCLQEKLALHSSACECSIQQPKPMLQLTPLHRMQSLATACGICGGRCGTGTRFCPIT